MKFRTIFLLAIFFVSAVWAEEVKLNWPLEIEKPNLTVTLYQPQLESFKSNILEGRMALSVKQKEEEPVFGAIWFKTRLLTDTESRIAVLEEFDILRTRFPGVEDSSKVEQFNTMLIKEIEDWNLEMSLDRIIASLSETENLNAMSDQLNNDPPDIYFRTSPAVLISIDSDPIFQQVEGAGFEYVVNTPYFILKDENGFYIKGGKFWYESQNAGYGYTETKSVPGDIEKFAKENLPESDLDSISESITEAPELIVVTSPSELISTDGEPDYASVEGTSLLFVTNTDSDIIMDIESQNHFVLLAGRWYSSRSLKDGDWAFTEPDELPEDFERIPEDSDIGNVRVSVPGTEEAHYALLEQSVPQTAAVDRSVTVEVKWDGDPKFKDVKGTEVKVAKNADKTVLKIEEKYYCIDDAIWFIAKDPKGPWMVSDIRPDAVDELPPDSEAYNVKYVYVYESTPEVVYVGYLPGYNWSFVYGGCVVYGTGFWYRPWWGSVYYPRPVTWGFGVHYNPWTGWGFSFGMSYGWVGWGFHPHRAWWGPRGYHHGYRHGYHRGYHHGYRRGAAVGFRAGYAAGSRNSNVYRDRTSGVKTTTRSQVTASDRNLNTKARPSNKPNNVYADRNGNVYQRDRNGNWENRNNNSTRDQQSRDRSNQQYNQQNRQTIDRSYQSQDRSRQQYSNKSQNRQNYGSSGMNSQQRQQMNKSYQNRNRGTQNYNRAQSYNRNASRSSYGSSRGGASRGGGRRR